VSCEMSCPCGYSIASNLARHKRTCKVIAWHEKCVELERQVDGLMAENVCLKERQVENERLREENLELTVRLKEARAARPVQNVNNNVTINVVPYGQEEALSAAEVRGILQQLPGSETIPRYIEMKHFRNPESSNIRITNKRGRIMQVVEEDGLKRRRWVDRDRTEMLSAITEKSLEELLNEFDAEKYKRWNQWYELSGLDNEGFDKTDAFREIMKKVDNMITSQNRSNEL
jgi:hypothetical protein